MRTLLSLLFVFIWITSQGKKIDDSNCTNERALHGNDFGDGRRLSFIENKGQVTDENGRPRNDIQYKVAAAPGLNIFIGNGAIHYQFNKTDDIAKCAQPPTQKKEPSSHHYSLYRMDVTLAGSNKDATVTEANENDYIENHYKGKNNAKTSHSFSKLTYTDIYPHIDWVLKIESGRMEEEFVVKEGGSVADIQLNYNGATSIALNDDGSITAAAPMGSITEQAPTCYEHDGGKVQGAYVLTNNRLQFKTGAYSGSMVIDPALEWATYYGATNDAYAVGTATDDSGNVLATGWTNCLSSIATSGAYEVAYNGGSYDAFLAKFDSTGAIRWASYYGSSGEDVGYSVATDTAGIYITGWTSSTSGIATPGTFSTTYNGGAFDAFVARFSNTGTLQWATYFGGSGDDEGKGIVTDAAGNIYVAGWTNSISGIATSGAHQMVYGGGAYDAFLSKFNDSGALEWSTYYGGSGEDVEFGLACDNFANVFITGYTPSLTGIATAGAYQTTEADGGAFSDAFLAKFDSSGTMQWGTYFGGPAADYGQSVATDDSGNIYVSGYTSSTSGIATPGAYMGAYAGGSYDIFLAKFNTDDSIQWATYYGGSDADYGQGIAIDDSGKVYVTGFTASDTGIATPDAWNATFISGLFDAVVAQFSSSGARLWGSYYGGSGDDESWAVSTFGSGLAYIVGRTTATSDVSTTGAYETTFGGVEDGFLAKFSFCSQPSAGTISGIDSVCIDSVITLANAAPGGVWSSSNTARATVINGTVTGLSAGADTISYTVSSSCGEATAQKAIYIQAICNEAVGSIRTQVPALALFPNPVQNELNISASYIIGRIAIYNLLGQMIYNQTCQSQDIHINTEAFIPGIYVVKINGSEVVKFEKH